MAYIFVHLSDIHFGQEKGGQVFIHDDVKEQLLVDVHNYVGDFAKGRADGVIISGDVAYSGKKKDYDNAGQWLDRLTAAIGCEITDVQVVPGNHDVDLDKVTAMTQLLIDHIISEGDDALDNFLQTVEDREFFYGRFNDYRKFAEGYDSGIDADGYIMRQRRIEIAPGRTVMFHGVNTALICSKSKKESGGLLLGKRQRVLPTHEGLELVVIAHHPLNWLQDSEDAQKYLRSRARVFISGHEHLASHKVEALENGGDLLMISSGAAIPPKPDDKYTYCYNLLEFDWDKDRDALSVTIHARIWDDNQKCFTADDVHYKNGRAGYILNCPNFKKLTFANESVVENGAIKDSNPQKLDTVNLQSKNVKSMIPDREYQLVLLKFFRDLSNAQRLTILINFGAIPDTWSDQLTHSLERQALENLVAGGSLSQIHEAINSILYSNK